MLQHNSQIINKEYSNLPKIKCNHDDCLNIIKRFEENKEDQYEGKIGQNLNKDLDIKKSTDLFISGKEIWKTKVSQYQQALRRLNPRQFLTWSDLLLRIDAAIKGMSKENSEHLMLQALAELCGKSLFTPSA